MIIKKANIEDLNDNFIKLYINGFIYHYNGRPDIFKCIDEEKLENDIRQKIENDEDVLIILEENKIIGFLIYDIKNKHDKIMWIEQLFIDEKYRKKGYGQRIIEKAEEIAKRENCVRIEFSCWSFNMNALEMYKHIGYKEQRIILEKNVD